MPVISTFYGVTIKMYFKQSEHNPPHVHAIYGDYASAFDIRTGKILDGNLPKRAQKMVKQWIKRYSKELLEIWITQEFKELPPLE